MIRPLAVLALCLWARIGGQAQSTNDEVRLQATVQAIVPLTSFSGTVTPVDIDPRFALTVRIESIVPELKNFSAGTIATCAIHSPTLLFAGEPTKGRIYDFVLHREIKNGKVKFFGLHTAP